MIPCLLWLQKSAGKCGTFEMAKIIGPNYQCSGPQSEIVKKDSAEICRHHYFFNLIIDP